MWLVFNPKNAGLFQEQPDDTSNARWQKWICETSNQGVCGHSQISEEQLQAAIQGRPSKNAVKLVSCF